MLLKTPELEAQPRPWRHRPGRSINPHAQLRDETRRSFIFRITNSRRRVPDAL